jgi:drug/metabolite transporter (DMT)-like permease
MNPALLGIVSAVSWGCLDLIASLSSRRLGALSTVLGVTVGGFLALSLYLLAAREGLPAFWGTGSSAAYLSGALIALASLFLFAAFASGPIAVVSPIVSSYPLTAMLIAFATGDKPPIGALVAAAVVIAGVVMVASTEPGGSRFEASLGRCITLSALSHITWAFAIFAGQYATAGVEASAHAAAGVTWLGRIAGLALVLPVFVLARNGAIVPIVWWPAFALIGGLDVAGTVALNLAAHSAHPVVATVVASCFGVVTILLSRFVLKEAIPMMRWIGIAITFAGVAALVALSHQGQT